MILFELQQTEQSPIYQELAISNGARQYSFLASIVAATLAAQRPFLSQHIIKALNFQAITCLHINAGEYRPCGVTVGSHTPPADYRVRALMDDFINQVNVNWNTADPVVLAAFVLWKLCYIHPFINGNGRTARAACYFVLCVKAGHWLPGTVILPELIVQNRPEYVQALEVAHASFDAGQPVDLLPLHALLSRLVAQQIGVPAPVTPVASASAPVASASAVSTSSSAPVATVVAAAEPPHVASSAAESVAGGVDTQGGSPSSAESPLHP